MADRTSGRRDGRPDDPTSCHDAGRAWHVAPATWRAYVGGVLDPAAEAAVDTHVSGCGHCRAAARAHLDPARVEEVWQAVRSSVRTPRTPAPLRWTRRLGVPEDELVLLGAADGVLIPWITAVGAALACAIVSGFSGIRHEAAFLGLAPLVPVLAVVAAFDATESLRAISQCTPYPKLRLALIRTTAALAVALPVTMVVGALVPNLDGLAFAWLLPGLMLTSAALVLLTRLAPWLVGGLLSLVWMAGVGVLEGSHRLDLVTGAWPQTGGALVLVVVWVGVSRRPRRTGAR